MRRPEHTPATHTRKMIKVSSNLGQVAASLSSKLTEFKGVIKDKVTRAVATTELAEVKVRIHQDGLKADESPIGEYKNAYLKRRQKKPYNRTADSKIIFSLTRKMENEFVVIPSGDGYGLGWIDGGKESVSNLDKSKFLEERFGDVYKLTKKEQSLINPIAERATQEELRRLGLL